MALIQGDSLSNHLIGTPQADDIRGYDGDDMLDGGGNDQLRGGPGNDIYITDGGDTLIESANQGIDEVRSRIWNQNLVSIVVIVRGQEAVPYPAPRDLPADSPLARALKRFVKSAG